MRRTVPRLAPGTGRTGTSALVLTPALVLTLALLLSACGLSSQQSTDNRPEPRRTEEPTLIVRTPEGVGTNAPEGTAPATAPSRSSQPTATS